MHTALTPQPVVIHGVPCLLHGQAGDYRVARSDSGAQLAQAPRRFLALARAAVLLHTPRRSA